MDVGGESRQAKRGKHVAWAKSVFRAPLLRGLDERGREDVQKYGRLRECGAGEVLFRPDDPSDVVFIVVSGRVELHAVARGDESQSLLRSVGRDGTLGEEAVIGLKRNAEAICGEHTTLAEVPARVLERAVTRSGAQSALELEMRQLRREATRELLLAQAFSRYLPGDDLELLLDAVHFRSYQSGEFIYRQGDFPEHCLLLQKGLVQIQSEAEGRVRVHGYLSAGDFYGDEEILTGYAHRFSAVALGATVCIHPSAQVMRSVCDRNPGLVRKLRRLTVARRDGQAAPDAPLAGSTQHVLKDAYRMQMARSLLAIDQNSCVRCGHCAWACAELHDGVTRLIRSGDKVLVPTSASPGELASLLLPNTCQHCEHPACMIDCPTGAIGRDPEGEVFIKSESCTGCGACAKACPWQNIQLAPRQRDARPRQTTPEASMSALVAVKCDLCRDYEAPGCVQACPTDAVQRLDPSEAFTSVRQLFGDKTSPTAAAQSASGLRDRQWQRWSLLAGMGLCVAGVLLLPEASSLGSHAIWGSGLVGALGIVALAMHAAVKRGVRLWVKPRRRGMRSRNASSSRGSVVSPWVRAHQSVGWVTLAVVAWHSGASWSWSVSGALVACFALSAGAGVFGALSYAVIPRRLTRLESRGALPEELPGEHARLTDRLYQLTSGQDLLVKKVAERILLPYSRSRRQTVALLLSGRDLTAERARLRQLIDARLEGRGAERLGPLDELIKTVVDLRALPLRRLLTGLLRVWQPLHAGLTFCIVVLLALHVLSQVHW